MNMMFTGINIKKSKKIYILSEIKRQKDRISSMANFKQGGENEV